MIVKNWRVLVGLLIAGASSAEQIPTVDHGTCVEEVKTTTTTTTGEATLSDYEGGSGASDYSHLPIQLLSADQGLVRFNVLQTWKSSGSITWIATHFVDPLSGHYRCTKASNVDSAQKLEFVAACVDGEATVELFVRDNSLNGPPVDVPDMCNANGQAKRAYTFDVPCRDPSTNVDTSTSSDERACVDTTPNNPPNAVNDQVETEEDTPVALNVIGNDSDPDGDPLTASPGPGDCSNGVMNVASNGDATYTPNAGFCDSSDTCEYTIEDGQGGQDTANVIITVTCANVPPVAVDDDAETNEGTPVDLNVIGNDSDPDGDPLTASPGPADCSNGVMTVASNGDATYIPNAGFCDSSDTCEYTIEDGKGGQDTANVIITVTCVNVPPVAVDDDAETNEGTPVDLNVIDNDSDPDGDPLTASYVPNSCANGLMEVSSNGDATYFPDPDFCGSTDTCGYTVSDGQGGQDTGNVVITVYCINEPPIGVDDIAATDEGTPVELDVLDNDIDPDDDELTASLGPGTCDNGVLQVDSDGDATYTPNPDFCGGSDTCEYTVSDGQGLSDTANVIVTVNCAENTPPVAVDDEADTDEDTPVDLNVLDNDMDYDGDDLTSTLVPGSCGNGDLTVAPNGDATYTPNPNFCSDTPDTCRYTVLDGQGGADTGNVIVTVRCVNDPPIAVDDTAETNEGTPVDLNVLGNDSDPDGDTLVSTLIPGSCSNGVLVVAPNGDATYTPNDGFCGNTPDTCAYTASDGNGGQDTANVIITVRCTSDGGDGGPVDGGANGDPHFKTWAGEHFDYHGLCDLILLENHAFQDNLGMDIHIRTKKIKQWSYISNAVLRIGEDTLEVMGNAATGASLYWMNGAEGAEIKAEGALLGSLSGYPVTFERRNEKQQTFTVDLGDNTMIVFKTWNDLVRVDVLGATSANFGSSRGLMGKFQTGEHMGRDNLTEIKDLNAFGQEWQVQVFEPKLFHMLEGAQSPQLCEAPSALDMRRRLRESLVSQSQAEIACASVGPKDRDLCVFDVMATNNLDLAGAY